MAYTILEDCINCDACRAECPTESVSAGDDIYLIDANTCVECVDHYDAMFLGGPALKNVNYRMRESDVIA